MRSEVIVSDPVEVQSILHPVEVQSILHVNRYGIEEPKTAAVMVVMIVVSDTMALRLCALQV